MKAHPVRTTSTDVVPRVARTLLTNAYSIDGFDRPADGACLFQVRRQDVLGGEARTVLLFAQSVSRALFQRLIRTAVQYHGAAVVVARGARIPTPASVQQLTELEFFRRLGGEIRTDRIFVPKLPTLLHALGHGRVPKPLQGDADTLLEGYAQDCWSYLLDCPVRRYGQDRSYERLPDGLLLGRSGYNVCFDTKAYRRGYHPSASDMRAFADYVSDFNQRYEAIVGRVAVFLVVSGSFPKSIVSLNNRSTELLGEVGTPLVFVTAKQLGDTVDQIRALAHGRSAIKWSSVLAPPVFDSKRLATELRRIKRDAIG